MSVKDLFLEAMRASLEDRTIKWKEPVSTEEWKSLFELADVQNVLPMVYQSVYNSESFRATAFGMIPFLRRNVMNMVLLQVKKNQEFLDLYRTLAAKGLTPIVVKGAIVRFLYPNSDNRSSCDEDFYIPEGTYTQYKRVLAEFGMKLAEWDKEKEDSNHEVSYFHEGGVLKIEIHKDLFDYKCSVYQSMNDLFRNSFETSIMVDIDGVSVRTMNHTEHMLFMILHAFKHFVTGGFGIRQVCDMVVYGNIYGKQIDWGYLLDNSKSFHADYFVAAIFDIGYRYLGFDYARSGYPLYWQKISVDSAELLNDMIDAGIFGASSMSRKHSSNMTLNAVVADLEGKTSHNSLLKTIFPPLENLEGRYPYLQGHRALLPVAWFQRIIGYRKEICNSSKGNSAIDSMKIGNQRIELLKKYGIITEERRNG